MFFKDFFLQLEVGSIFLSRTYAFDFYLKNNFDPPSLASFILKNYY